MDIRIRGIAKDFGRFPALHGIDLDIRAGELLALLGPSGSGKTTLLRVIAGLEIPTRGQIFFGDEDASAKPVQERNVGFVFQHYALFRHMTVLDNVAFGLTVRDRARRPPRAEIRRRARELLDFVQLPGLEHRYPQQLSGGQRQRVALARALAVEPRVLLLDEPFGALDAQVRKELRRWLRDVHDRTGYTTVFVTHDQDEALEIADRVVVLNRGAIEQVGTPDEIYDRPASAFVYGFVGDANRVPVELRNGDVLFEGAPIALPTAPGLLVAPAGLGDGAALLVLRPPHVAAVAPGSPGALPARITSVHRHGAVRRVECALGDGRAMVEIDLPVERPTAVGEALGLVPLKCGLFPAGEAAAAPAPAAG